ncbi:TrbC/VirB2 family protein [Mesorhizobium sp. SB112]|uniref:TrbC/VirB2 family protein n=1 Tax=Mesorhizobium sp. SB112 TaxID=3151853 RepID=UPI0032663799
MSHSQPPFSVCVLALPISMALIIPAFAASGGGLPWEAPLEQIQQSITGPVAGFIALTAVAVAGGMLIFGGELNDFARRLMYIVLVAGILLGATQIVALFGATGASVGNFDDKPQLSETLADLRWVSRAEGVCG